MDDRVCKRSASLAALAGLLLTLPLIAGCPSTVIGAMMEQSTRQDAERQRQREQAQAQAHVQAVAAEKRRYFGAVEARTKQIASACSSPTAVRESRCAALESLSGTWFSRACSRNLKLDIKGLGQSRTRGMVRSDQLFFQGEMTVAYEGARPMETYMIEIAYGNGESLAFLTTKMSDSLLDATQPITATLSRSAGSTGIDAYMDGGSFGRQPCIASFYPAGGAVEQSRLPKLSAMEVVAAVEDGALQRTSGGMGAMFATATGAGFGGMGESLYWMRRAAEVDGLAPRDAWGLANTWMKLSNRYPSLSFEARQSAVAVLRSSVDRGPRSASVDSLLSTLYLAQSMVPRDELSVAIRLHNESRSEMRTASALCRTSEARQVASQAMRQPDLELLASGEVYVQSLRAPFKCGYVYGSAPMSPQEREYFARWIDRESSDYAQRYEEYERELRTSGTALSPGAGTPPSTLGVDLSIISLAYRSLQSERRRLQLVDVVPIADDVYEVRGEGVQPRRVALRTTVPDVGMRVRR